MVSCVWCITQSERVICLSEARDEIPPGSYHLGKFSVGSEPKPRLQIRGLAGDTHRQEKQRWGLDVPVMLVTFYRDSIGLKWLEEGFLLKRQYANTLHNVHTPCIHMFGLIRKIILDTDTDSRSHLLRLSHLPQLNKSLLSPLGMESRAVCCQRNSPVLWVTAYTRYSGIIQNTPSVHVSRLVNTIIII